MKIFKIISMCCLVMALTGCFPGEKKVFEEQEMQSSASRADEISVAIADAVQNELSAFFMTQNGQDPSGFAFSTGGDTGIVRTAVCANGVFAYIAPDMKIRGLETLDKGSGMQMMRSLQDRFGSNNVGYKTAQSVNGINNVRSEDTACFNQIQSQAIAIGSPIVALNFANIQPVLPPEFTENLSKKMIPCETGYIGKIPKQCTTNYQFYTNGDQEGQIIVGSNGVPNVTQTCNENITDADREQYCRVASDAPTKSFQISSGIAVGTDWSAFFQNPGSDVPLTVKCVSVNGQDECAPYDPDIDPAVVVECSDEGTPVRQVINPIVEYGQPVPEIDGNGSIVDRECGFGWRGQLVADYQTRVCKTYNVDPVTGDRSEHEEPEKSTIYQMYYVAAKCQKQVNQREACTFNSRIGSVLVNQNVAMNEPLALHPHNIGRGETPTSTIAVASEFNSDPKVPAALKARVDNQDYILSTVDLNVAEDDAEFTQMLTQEMNDFITATNKKCVADESGCSESVLPPITVALVDRSGSMNFGDQVASTKTTRSCKASLIHAFKPQDRTAACNILDDLNNIKDNCQELKYQCEYDSYNDGYCDPYDYSCNDPYGYGSGNDTCDYEYESCLYQQQDFDDSNDPYEIFDFVKGEYSDFSNPDNQPLRDILYEAISQSYDSDSSNGRRIDCGTLMVDELGETRGASGLICDQSLSALPCQDGCPGTCVSGTKTLGDPVNKIVAVDNALKNILVPQLQYGSSFLYSYFSGNGIDSVLSDIPECKITDDPSTTTDDALPFCDDDAEDSVLTEKIEEIQGEIDEVAREPLGSTPLFSAMDYTLAQLDLLIAARGETPETAQIAFYLMTDGAANPFDNGRYNRVCDVFSNKNAFSVGFKEKYPASRLYVLNLPGDAEPCGQFSAQTDEPIDLAKPPVYPPDDPNITVDAFFQFTTQKDHFADLFGDTGVVKDIDGYQSCLDEGFLAENIIGEIPDDGEVTEGGDGSNAACPITLPWTRTCLGIDGDRYPMGSYMCGPSCISWDGSERYLVGTAEANNNCGPTWAGCTNYVTRDRIKYNTNSTFPASCQTGCVIDDRRYYKGSFMCKTNQEKCASLKDNAKQAILWEDPSYNPDDYDDPYSPDYGNDPADYISDSEIIESGYCDYYEGYQCDNACNYDASIIVP